MGNLSFDDKVALVNSKARELMELLYDMNNGLDVDFNEVVYKLLDIHKDELRLLRTIKKYETEIEHKEPCTLDFTGFMLCNEKRA